MERLCDEVVQIIFYDLADPAPLTLVNKRFYHFSQDPYVRAHYFLTHYGPTEAIFHALGRGKILNEQVLDILLTSGAHLSRYLVQVSMHHYFHTATHFIKSNWVRGVPFGVFMHFLRVAEAKYGDIPRAKNEGDGYIFNHFLKQSRWPTSLKSVTWETIQEMLEKYNFIPFSNRDPLMAQFPLALAIEPRLLPYAVNNGFHMDSKYRDFVFRKMFERTSTNDMEQIIHNVKELCRLDTTMFVSRTVAAEVCMEAKTNVAGYGALKTLDKSGHLRFELADLVGDLIKTFIKTRSLLLEMNVETLRHIYIDYPSSDSTARLVMLIIFFNNAEDTTSLHEERQAKLESMKLTPVTRKDIFDILLNPFSKFGEVVLDYSIHELGTRDDAIGKKGTPSKEMKKFIAELVSRCLEVSCKGKLLNEIKNRWPADVVNDALKKGIEKYRIGVEDLPPSDDVAACRKFSAKLSQDYTKAITFNGEQGDSVEKYCEPVDVQEFLGCNEESGKGEDIVSNSMAGSMDLGHISQETLCSMIRNDELLPTRSKRRTTYHHYPGLLPTHISNKLPYPEDALPVAQWIKKAFGHRSRITAVFMTHAVINENDSILECYLPRSLDSMRQTQTRLCERVPVTLQHFKLLAHLGKEPNYRLFCEVRNNCQFYFDEEDYLEQDAKSTSCGKPIKAEASSTSLRVKPEGRRRKRPRRMATAGRSYVVPDSDDDAIAADDDDIFAKPKLAESNLRRWILHLSELLKEEDRKHAERKRRHNVQSEPGVKPRIYKSEFHRSLALNVRELRQADEAQQILLYGHVTTQETYSSDDDDDYLKTRSKRRKTTRN